MEMTSIHLEDDEDKLFRKSTNRSLVVDFPIQVRVMTVEETKEYHLKKLYQLSLKTLRETPQLVKPTEEQKRWVLYKLKHIDSWPNVHENKIGDTGNWI